VSHHTPTVTNWNPFFFLKKRKGKVKRERNPPLKQTLHARILLHRLQEGHDAYDAVDASPRWEGFSPASSGREAGVLAVGTR
jgi:hypothetical protein